MRRGAWRRRARYGCLVVAVLLLAGAFPAWIPAASGARLVVETSPFVAIGAALARHTIGIGTVLGLLFTVPVLVRKRWYCHYVCPTGLLLDLAGRGRRPNAPRLWARWPVLGRPVALVTLAGALAGYPLLLWLDPLALFASPFAIPGDIAFASAAWVAISFGVIALACLLLGNLWCARLCPLGGLQDLLLSLRLLLWRMLCRGARASHDPLPAIAPRRALLIGGIGVALALLARRVGKNRSGTAPLRPPGAVAEDEFTGACVRCGNCASVCPTRIIEPDLGGAGIAGLLAPMLRFDELRYCREDCHACTVACPSGALTRLALPDKRRYVIGEALVDAERCLLILGRKECDACAQACPYRAIEMAWDETQYLAFPQIDYRRCNGCGACQVVCPTEEIKAIAVWPLLDEDRAGAAPRYLAPRDQEQVAGIPSGCLGGTVEHKA
ncbi:MAG: 4Fe-4S dicluster domain-containing protein [Gammaproteobacteria bacterium]|nr:4Fe-4S dicluster domain-containing protein [Gammaproteobacteria bacterium]